MERSNGTLIGYSKSGSGNDFLQSVVSIAPDDAAMTPLLETPYATLFGMAADPEQEGRFITWANSESGHFYGELDLATETITLLSDSDSVRVTGPMQFLSFDVAMQGVPEPDFNPIWLLILLCLRRHGALMSPATCSESGFS